jgi:acetyl esterase/lipase
LISTPISSRCTERAKDLAENLLSDVFGVCLRDRGERTMAFDDLPAQPPIFPAEAALYARRALELSRDAASRCDVVFDLPYGKDYSQRVDIYRSKKASVNLPVLVFAHGGAWTNGYKEWMGLMAPAITDFPAVFVSVSHRLAPAHRYPEPFDDCMAALGWVHRNIREYGGDPGRIYVGGHSSGGHLYALVTLRRDARRSAGLAGDVIRACFPVSARFNMVFDDPKPGTTEHRHQTMLFAPGENVVLASPLHQIEGNEVPFLIAWGARDLPAIIENGERMFEALVAQGTRVERLVVDGHDHFDMALELRNPSHPWVTAVREWMTVGSEQSRR